MKAISMILMIFYVLFPLPDAKGSGIEISAEDLVGAYLENEIAADQLYKDKYVNVSGIVESIAKDILGHPFILLKSKHFIKVQCTFYDPKAIPVLARLKPGQKISVEGICLGKFLNVQIKCGGNK